MSRFACFGRGSSFCWFSLLAIYFRSCTADSALDSSIRDSTFATLGHRLTGDPFFVSVPVNLSGIEAYAVLLRGRSLWVAGANFSGAMIPPRTKSNPYVQRVALIFQNMANWSSSFYTIEGFTLVSPVLSLLAYNATDFSNSVEIQEVDLNPPGESSIRLQFPELKSFQHVNSSSLTKCVAFRGVAQPEFTGSPLNNSCSTKILGHFAIVIPSSPAFPNGVAVPNQNTNHNKETMLWWVIAVIGGSGGVILGLVVIGVLALLKKKKKTSMERRGEEGVALGSVLIGGIRIPKAEMTRTNPIILDDLPTAPP